MKTYTLILFTVFLTACATSVGLQKTSQYELSNPVDERAKLIYDTAKKCWSKDASFFDGWGTIVSSNVSLEGVEISARWVPLIETHEQAPFIRFIISELQNGSVVEIYEKPHFYAGKAQVHNDAVRWANGDYSCST
jgi:hypothetical protein